MREKVKPRQVKIGHTGTLDPFATGLLVLLIGKKYTKLAQEFTKLDKEYEAEITLGYVSDSGDNETELHKYSDIKPSIKEIEQTLTEFEGKILQKPPIYSALKINGQRAYKLARAGKTVEMDSRLVHIYNSTITKYDYPTLSLITKVSSGTYIRSLAMDIGHKLKTGAYLKELKRTQIGQFKLEKSINIQDVTYKYILQHIQQA